MSLRKLRSPAVALGALLAFGCAHAPPPVDHNLYRSAEGYSEAKWGMTPEELQGRLANAERPDAFSYRTHESVDGRPATVTYAFPDGHLASVSVALDPPAGLLSDYDATYERLAHRYGDPLPAPGARQNQDDAAMTVVAILAAVLVVGIIVAIVAHGHGGGGMHPGAVHGAAAIGSVAAPVGMVHPVHAAIWVDFAALRLTADALELGIIASESGPRAPGGWMAEWRTPESDVVLLGVGLGGPNGQVAVCYRSLALNPQLPPP